MRAWILPLLLSISFCSLPSWAQSTNISIGVEETDYLPHYTGVGGKYDGFAKEFFDKFAKDNQITLNYAVRPVPRLWAEFLDKKLDLKYPDNSVWNAEAKKGKQIYYSKPIASYTDGVMVKPANKGKPQSELKTLGTVTGFLPYQYLNDVKAGKMSLHENPNFEGLISQGELGRVNGIYANVEVINYKLSKMSKSGQLVFDESLPHTKSEYLVSSFNKELIDKLDKWMIENKTFIADLKAKYNLK